MPYIVYTKELLGPIVKESFSIAEVLRKLGYEKYGGGHHSHLAKRIKDFRIDTSHFLGQAWNRGKISVKKKSAEEILILRKNGYRGKAYQLRRALIEVGVPYVCLECNMKPIWNGKKLVLHVDHKNGNFLDDRKENLCFLCPNCHSQGKN